MQYPGRTRELLNDRFQLLLQGFVLQVATLVEGLGGLAIDVTASSLAPRLLETYLKVKERGLL